MGLSYDVQKLSLIHIYVYRILSELREVRTLDNIHAAQGYSVHASGVHLASAHNRSPRSVAVFAGV